MTGVPRPWLVSPGHGWCPWPWLVAGTEGHAEGMRAVSSLCGNVAIINVVCIVVGGG